MLPMELTLGLCLWPEATAAAEDEEEATEGGTEPATASMEETEWAACGAAVADAADATEAA